jgi:hypothetical protein
MMAAIARNGHAAMSDMSPLPGVKRKSDFGAVRAAFVQVFGRRDADTIHAVLRPASKKRQGTKSRDVSVGGAACAMGILPQVRACRGWIEAVAAIGLRRSMVACVGVNERSAGRTTRLVVRRL